MAGHRTRVGTLAWSSHILSSGSRDRNILQRDVRVQEDFVSKLVGHKSEVKGHFNKHHSRTRLGYRVVLARVDLELGK